MAITATDYVKSDPKVKAARAELASANERVSKLTGVDFPGAEAALKDAKAKQKIAQSKYNAATKKASDYFNANKEEILAAEESKQAKEKQAGEEAVQRIIGSGRVSEAEQQVIGRAGRKPAAAPGKDKGAQGGGAGGKASDVDRINAALAAEAETKKATEYISSLNDNERLIWAKSLKDAGYDVLETGTLNRGLIEAYQSALSDTQAENTFYKDTKNFKPYSLTDYLAYRTGLVNIGKGGGVDTTFDITTLTDVDAAAYVENVLQSELKRKPTTEEINALIPALKAYARATPVKTTATDTTRTRTSGPNPIDWLTQVIRGQQELVGFNLKNKKEAVKAKSAELAIKKLSKEVEQKGLNTLANFSENIRNTINANGLGKVINQFQIDEWAKRLQNGESKDTVDREIRNIAKIGMPDTVKSLIDSGINLDTIYSPYRKAMATILEISPETISLDDSLLRKAIGPQGEMPIYEFERLLRQDPRWEQTDTARQEVSTAALRVLQDFGFQG